MKRIAAVLAMLLVFASPAMAEFTSTNLILSVYNNTTTAGDQEFGFNTGFNLAGVDWNSNFTYTIDTNLDLTWFNPTGDATPVNTTWADLNLGVWGRSIATGNNADYFLATTNQNEIMNLATSTSYASATNAVRVVYNTADADDDNIAILANNRATTPASYDRTMNNAMGTPGNYAGTNSGTTDGEVSLSGFGDSNPDNDVVRMYLHGMTRTGPTSIVDMDLNKVGRTTYITLDSNGMLTIVNQVVPVPGAVWLLGSGLLGLLGLRRKNA